jgi:antitoxin YefM
VADDGKESLAVCRCGSQGKAPIDRILSVSFGSSMQTISYTDARNRLAGLMEAATRDREPITITRNGAGTVVLLAAEEFAAMEETLHLLSTPANANRIRQGLEDFKSGKLRAGALCD